MQKPASTPRTQRLRQRALEMRPAVCTERARILTEVYRETEHEPPIIRRAKGLRRVLEEMSIFIADEELLVGNVVSTPRGAPIFPEVAASWVREEMDTFETRPIDKFALPQDARDDLLTILPYWENKTVEARVRATLPEETRNLIDAEFPVFSPQNMYTNMVGHLILDYGKALSLGLGGIRKLVVEKLERLDLANPEDLDKRQFYEAELIVCEGVTNYIKRYAAEAEVLAERARDSRRKRELKRIGQVCDWISDKAPRDFYEAIQLYLFVHIMGHFETDAQAISTGRFDYLLYPFYKKDLEEGRLTREDALELLECFWIKNFEMNHIFNLECSTYFGGYAIVENMILGGQTEDGSDAVNELSYLCLEAEDRMKLTQPAIAVRLHKNVPREFLTKACEVVRNGGGKPSFFNDELIVPQLLSEGVPLGEARNYAIVGCVEPTTIGSTYGWTNAAMFNLAKCLELALNNGVCRLSKKQLGPATGDPRAFACFGEVLDAFRTQVAYFVKHMVISLNITDLAQADLCPLPFLSLMVSDCLEKGMDISRGGARYNYTGPQGVGLADVADSLAAVKKLVFEEKKIAMDELLEALDGDFAGKEQLRAILMSEAPKYGNDDDYVDSIAKLVADIYCDEVAQYKNPRGGAYRPGLYPLSANVPMGMRVGALPNGRKARTPLADGISPTHNSDMNGPTAVLKSVAKIDHMKATNGTQLNQWLTPSILEGDKGLNAFADLIASFFSLGGLHVQFNVVSKDMLREAQSRPHLYRTLMVRVAGYSAFFVELDESIQNDIIGRTEQMRF